MSKRILWPCVFVTIDRKAFVRLNETCVALQPTTAGLVLSCSESGMT